MSLWKTHFQKIVLRGDISNEKTVAEKLLSPDPMLIPSHQAVQASDESVVPAVVEPDDGKAGLRKLTTTTPKTVTVPGKAESSKSTTTTPKTVPVHDMHSQQPRYPLKQRKPPDYYGRGNRPKWEEV